MSLLRETNEALSILVRTRKWYRSWVCCASFVVLHDHVNVGPVNTPQLQDATPGPNERLVQEAHMMLADFMTPIRANPRHLYQSALAQTPRTHLLWQRYPLSHPPVSLVFGEYVSSGDGDLHWKVE